MRDEQKAAILAELERYVIRPIGEGEITVRDVMGEYGLSYSSASHLLEGRVESGEWTCRVALVNGKRGKAYRPGDKVDKAEGES